MRPQRSVGLIIILASLILIVAVEHWYATRILVPLDQPIALVPGRITTNEFRINLRGRYHITVFFRDHPPNDEGCSVFGALSQRWRLISNGRIAASSSETSFGAKSDGIVWGPYFGSFNVGPGTYKLDVDLLTGTTCADNEAPRLEIWTTNDFSRGLVQATFWACLFSALIGSVLVLRSFTRRTRPVERTLSITGTHSFDASTLPHERRPRPIRTFAKSPSLGLVMSCIFGVVLLSIWVVQVRMYLSNQPKGTWVHLVRISPKVQIWPDEDFPVLRIEPRGQGTAFFVDSSPVDSADVKQALKSALQKRSHRFVYLSVDPNLQYSDAAQGIDIIHSVKAEVVLYTPKMEGPEFNASKQHSRSPKPVK